MIKRPIIRKVALILSGAVLLTMLLTPLPGSFLSERVFGYTNQYIVKSGDSLYTIANKHSTTISALKQANSLNTDMIIPGQVLKIPSGSALGPNQYKVLSGDSLYKISQKYNTTVSELKWANLLNTDIIMPGQVLTIPVNQNKALKDIISERGVNIQTGGLEIYVDKSDHVLGLFSNGTFLKSYHVELGDNSLGDKEVSGDHKTPEGTFYISEKSVLNPADEYLGSRWMRLSYPNIEDANRGLKNGLISNKVYQEIVTANNNLQTPPQRTALGGGVGIHGGSTPQLGSDWTWGCVGLTNSSVEDFYDYVKVGTKVVIEK